MSARAERWWTSAARSPALLPGLVLLFHGVGVLGFALKVPHFERLTPLHLSVLTGCFLAARRWPARQLLALAGLGAAGFLVELLGVHTGFPFGDYRYDHALGPQLARVPVMIAVNWALLLAVCAALTEQLHPREFLGPRWSVLSRAALGATLMTLLDALIEPVAMQRGFWSWAGDTVPPQNYVAWWCISLLLLIPYFSASFDRTNRTASWIYGSELAFFALVRAL